MSSEKGDNVVRLPIRERPARSIDTYEDIVADIADVVKTLAEKLILGECPELFEKGLDREVVLTLVTADILSGMRDHMDDKAKEAATSAESLERHAKVINRLLWEEEGSEGDAP